MRVDRVHTINRTLILEIGYAGDMGAALLSDAIIEALEEKVIEQAGITYIKSRAPGIPLIATDIFIHTLEPEDTEPPEMPGEEEAEGSKANL